MSGKAVLVVGARGMGKTTTQKRLLNLASIDARLVMDLKGEYTGLYKHAPFYHFDDFTKVAKSIKNAVILIEEATIHLPTNSQNRPMTEILVNARQYNNVVLMSFHSLQRVPKYVYELSDTLILHKTGDDIQDVKGFGHPKTLDAFIELEKAPMLMGETGKPYSPQKVINLY